QDSGPCRGSIRRWSYDASRGFCVEFTYGGCQGNSNNFETREACEAKCSVSPSRNDVLPISSGGLSSNAICNLPQDTGPCRAQLPRWAFDASKGQCVQFNYGGCRGNENNFETIQECEAACGGSGTMDTSQCHLPLETGKCRGYFKKWGFDASSGQCIQFIYGGCGGNSNNFETKEACEQQCRASIPMPLGENDNLNAIDSVCKLMKDPGPCRGSISRWAFDSERRECTEFFYGGCQGNGNNFETRDACEAKCLGNFSTVLSISSSPVVPPISNNDHVARNGIQQISVCQLPHERGECIAYIPRWGYNAQSGKCVQFIYGGCGGNGNNFETQEDCEKKCNGKSLFIIIFM
ncbi:unnamed protein product, partial [Rodentolepis nana]|uniref:Kunitz/Bovine pancreatic trypsin inhibitor domain protein n=1 Tax=Rodentolepis nana TaxID=102285 RepID=A0A0R3TFN1_RODNA